MISTSKLGLGKLRPLRIVKAVTLKKQSQIKNSVTKKFYGQHISSFQNALQKKDVDKGAEILLKIPRILRNAFCKLSSL